VETIPGALSANTAAPKKCKSSIALLRMNFARILTGPCLPRPQSRSRKRASATPYGDRALASSSRTHHGAACHGPLSLPLNSPGRPPRAPPSGDPLPAISEYRVYRGEIDPLRRTLPQTISPKPNGKSALALLALLTLRFTGTPRSILARPTSTHSSRNTYGGESAVESMTPFPPSSPREMSFRRCSEV